MDLRQVKALDIREGDRVTVSLYVSRVHTDYLELSLVPNDVASEKGGGVHVAVNFGAVVEHTPRALQPGSAVKFLANPQSVRGSVLHIIGDRAWVRWASFEDHDEVVPLVRLERENRPAPFGEAAQ